MKEQYLIGIADRDFIRVSDGTFGTICTRNKESLESMLQKQKGKKMKLRLYKLVEVKDKPKKTPMPSDGARPGEF